MIHPACHSAIKARKIGILLRFSKDSNVMQRLLTARTTDSNCVWGQRRKGQRTRPRMYYRSFNTWVNGGKYTKSTCATSRENFTISQKCTRMKGKWTSSRSCEFRSEEHTSELQSLR